MFCIRLMPDFIRPLLSSLQALLDSGTTTCCIDVELLRFYEVLLNNFRVMIR